MLRLFIGTLFTNCIVKWVFMHPLKEPKLRKITSFQGTESFINCWLQQMLAFDTKQVLYYQGEGKVDFSPSVLFAIPAQEIFKSFHMDFHFLSPEMICQTSPPTVVFSRQRSKWWCWSSKMFSLTSSSRCIPASWAANLASAALFFATKAAPLVAFAIWMRANLAFWKKKENAD